MKEKKAAGWALILISFMLVFWIGWQNPDMTQTRLLIEFWPQYLVAILLALAGGYLSGYLK